MLCSCTSDLVAPAEPTSPLADNALQCRDNGKCLNIYLTDEQGNCIFNLSDDDKLSVTFETLIDYHTENNTSSALFTSWKFDNVYSDTYVYGGMAVRLSLWNGNTLLKNSKTYIISTEVSDETEFGNKMENWENVFAKKLGIDTSEILLITNNIIRNGENYKFEKPITIDMDIDEPTFDNVSLKIETKWVWQCTHSDVEGSLAELRNGVTMRFGNAFAAVSYLMVDNLKKKLKTKK